MKKTYFIPATEEVKVMGESPLMENEPGLAPTSGGLWGSSDTNANQLPRKW